LLIWNNLLLLQTENAVFRVAFLNRNCRFQGCFFKPKMPASKLLFQTDHVAFMVAFLKPSNAAFMVALFNRKCRLRGCFFKPKMPPLGMLL
jgi:hypothetical protein